MTTPHIGLIGGLATRAGIFYYEQLAEQYEAAGETLDLTMRHADVKAVLDHIARLDRVGLGTYLGGLANQLFGAGADVVAVSAIAPHIAIDEITEVADGPVLNALDAAADAIAAAGFERVAVFGNRAVMESNINEAVDAKTAVPLGPTALESVHNLYNDIALTGKRNTKPEVESLAGFAENAMALGAQAIVLAGTDLSSFYSEVPPEYPHIDLAKSHIGQIMAIGSRG
ncbi:MAG: aspartate/glutamate racemase family protein [Acidimicrobiales bacterium]